MMMSGIGLGSCRGNLTSVQMPNSACRSLRCSHRDIDFNLTMESLSTSNSFSKNLSTPCTISPSMSLTNINYSLTHVNKRFCLYEYIQVLRMPAVST